MKNIRLLFINYAILVTILVTLEIVGHLSYRLIKGKYIFQYKTEENILFEEHPYLVGTPKKNFELPNLPEGFTISTDNNGYRVTKNYIPTEGTINIICIGGSTTFGTGVTDQDSWPYILQKKLGNKYNVTNMGVPGYSTLEGIIQLSTIVPELKPDVLVIYQGWNDIRNYHAPNKSPDYFWHGTGQKDNLTVNKKTKISDFSFLNFLAKKIKKKISKVKRNEKNVLGHNDSYIDHLYIRNIKTIQLLCEGLNVKQLYIPQVLHLDSYSKSEELSDSWTPYIRNKNMPNLIKHMNSLMSQTVKKDHNVIVIDSILTKYQWSESDFVDVGHFSKKGGDQFSDLIITFLQHLENRQVDTTKTKNK